MFGKTTTTYLVAGLGNPERRYENTRHNVGFDASELLRGLLGCSLPQIKFRAEISKAKLGSACVYVARPLTYMNLSGTAIAEICRFYKIATENVIILCDDVNLPMATLRIRGDGSAGGHNGLKNIIECLGSDQFKRIRIGVGAKPEEMDLADYVLARMSEEELSALRETESQAAAAAKMIITDGLQLAMSRYNTPKRSE